MTASGLTTVGDVHGAITRIRRIILIRLILIKRLWLDALVQKYLSKAREIIEMCLLG